MDRLSNDHRPTVRHDQHHAPSSDDTQGVQILKLLLAADFVAVAIIGSSISIDTVAAKIVFASVTLTALGLLWRNFLRPAGKIVARTVKAVDALETLPKWRQSHDERLSVVEAEIGIVHTDVGNVANDVAAIRRELGIGDQDVRRQIPAAEPRQPRPPRST